MILNPNIASHPLMKRVILLALALKLFRFIQMCLLHDSVGQLSLLAKGSVVCSVFSVVFDNIMFRVTFVQ